MSEVAHTMLQQVGDGSKVAILLACQMMESGNEALKKGHFAKHVVGGMKKAVNEAISYIQENAHPLRDQHEVESVASTASKNRDIGHIIAECLGNVGKLGIIKFKRSGFAKTSVEIIEGIQFDRGYISPEFVTGQDSASWISDKCHILLYPGVISSFLEVLPLMELSAKSKIPLLIIAQDLRGEAIETLLLNVRKGIIKAVAVVIPATDDGGISLLMDIATKTGGQIVGPSTGVTLAHIDLEHLGVAERVVVTGNNTRIIGGEGSVEEVKRRIKQIDEALASASNVYEAEKYRDRLAMLAGATAIVDVGGVTLQEADENLYGFESALNSVMSGISYGAIPGGGVPLLMAQKRVAMISSDNQAEKSGIESVLKSLESPLSCLISNSNLVPEQITDQIKLGKSSSDGFNAETGNIENLLTVGMIDPVEMLIKALEIALSHTKMFLETTTWADQKSLDIDK